MGNNSINFKTTVGKIILSVTYDSDILYFKGSVFDFEVQHKTKITQEDSQVLYQAIYDWNSMPMEINQKFDSLKELAQYLQQNKNNLKVQNDCLVISKEDGYFFSSNKANKECFLPLINTQIYRQILLQSNEVILPPHPIKKVENPCFLPYLATVLIMSQLKNSKRMATNQGTGAIIGKTTVLTVAHNFYNRDYKLQAFSCYILVQTQSGLKKIKGKKWHILNQYKTVSDIDRDSYDFAHLELEDNEVITQNHILPLKWNLFNPNQFIEVIGFSNIYDQHLNGEITNTIYHIRCDKIISISERFIKYYYPAKNGMSGGPIVILEQGEFKLIGLHQGLKVMSQGILLTSFGKNPLQILTELSLSQKILHQDVLKNTQKDDQIKRLRQENERLKKKVENLVIIVQFSQDKGVSREFIKSETKIDLSETKINDQQVRTVCQSLPQLKYLKLNYCQHIKIIKLKNCKKIQEISIWSAYSLIDIQLEQMPALKKLDLSFCSLLQSIKLVQLIELEKIYLNKCSKLKEMVDLKNCKKLKELSLDWVNQSHQYLNQLLSYQFTQLVRLDLTGWKHIKFSQLELTNCKNLLQLVLDNTEITGDDVQRFGTQLPQLKSLSLYECQKVASLQLKNFNKLKNVELRYTKMSQVKVDQLRKYQNLSIQF